MTRTFELEASNACMRVLAQTNEAVYLRLPDFLQRPAGGNCSCGHCNGNAMWDTLVVPTQPGPNALHEWSYAVHMPPGAAEGFIEYNRKRGTLAAQSGRRA